ncbi:MAG: 30S ribosome-binding factor RbfA [Candidatus Nealsonbacteria bacterium]|nr:MAG: 30S ribosome-binding factor RbfA [Candidatus Nealsonbacteria bacterium]
MSKRIPRVNQLIQQELSQIILREIEFPKDILVTVTRIETSSNLIESKIYVSVMPEEKTSKVFQILNRQVYELQQKLNQRLQMRPIPRIKFIEEKETKEAGKIEEILERLKKEEK